MAYTHNWEVTSERISRDAWNLACAAAEHVFNIVQNEYGVKLVYGESRTSPPVTNQSAIRLNGHPDESKGGAGQDCIIRRTGSGSVRTGDDYDSRKPYDLAVVAVLNVVSLACPDFVWSSDGTPEQLASGLAIGRRAFELAKAQPIPEARADDEQQQQQQLPAAHAAQAMPQGNAAQLQQAMAMLMQALGGSGTVDAEAVRTIVHEELSKVLLPTKIEVVKDGQTKELGGAVHKVLPDVLKFLQNGINVLLVGPAGSGKTTLAMQCAEALEVGFYMTGAILQKYELLGFVDANGNYIRSSFRDAYEKGGVFLWDEMDSSNPAALVAFHAALENGHADFPDGQVKRHPDFVCIGAANTYGHGATREYIGRNALDGATLDRYAVVTMDYDVALEETLAGNREFVREVQAYRDAAAKLGIKHIISPRASIRGSKMLLAGMSKDMVLSALVWKGLPADQVEKIKREAGYGRF